MVPAIMLEIGLAFPAVARDAGTSPSVFSSTSLHQAGEDTEAVAPARTLSPGISMSPPRGL